MRDDASPQLLVSHPFMDSAELYIEFVWLLGNKKSANTHAGLHMVSYTCYLRVCSSVGCCLATKSLNLNNGKWNGGGTGVWYSLHV